MSYCHWLCVLDVRAQQHRYAYMTDRCTLVSIKVTHSVLSARMSELQGPPFYQDGSHYCKIGIARCARNCEGCEGEAVLVSARRAENCEGEWKRLFAGTIAGTIAGTSRWTSRWIRCWTLFAENNALNKLDLVYYWGACALWRGPPPPSPFFIVQPHQIQVQVPEAPISSCPCCSNDKMGIKKLDELYYDWQHL